jgi:8-oxo-dGTP pyrophosphatase MutT (NUDIX family)
MTDTHRHSVSVAAVITDDAGRVLVVQRRDTGKWEIPGGILEAHESIHAGMRREVQEETGVVTEPERLTGVYKNVRLGVVALVFRAHIISGQPIPTEESTDIAWWTPDEVTANMAETCAIRVLDALDTADVAVRLHDGVRLIGDESPSSSM